MFAAVVAALLFALAASEARSAPADRGFGLPSFVAATEPAWSPDGRKIAFIEQRSSEGTLYVINASGSGARSVIAREFDAGWPSWSPDGRRIAFDHSTATATDTSLSDLYIVSADGSGLRKVLSGGSQPAWGPGGKRIAFARPGRLGNDRIQTVSPNGSAVRLVAESRNECESYIEPTWSPDGEFVAFAATGAGGECGFSVFIGATRGFGARVRAIVRDWVEEPAWSPDGKKLALVKYPPVPRTPYYTVAIFDLRTRHVRSLRAGWHPRWSPDGRRLVFVRGNPFGPKPTSQIYVMDADGSNLRQLTR
jgi:Tol biopolymer transport system component